MGVLISLPHLTHRAYEKLQDKRLARKARKLEQAERQQQQQFRSGASPSQQQSSPRRPRPFESHEGRTLQQQQRQHEREEQTSLDILRQGLRDEHLATSPPPAGIGGTFSATREKNGTAIPGTNTNRRSLPPTYHDEEDSNNPKRDSTVVNALTQKNTAVTMASDSDYASFLDKANQDPSAGVAKSSSTKGQAFKATEAGVQVPTVLKKAVVDAYYVSDGDEPFEVVGLQVEGGKLPDEATFAKTINHPNPGKAGVEILDIAEWDPQGQYKEIVDAVREACKGSDVRVYKVGKDGARVEYWVVGVEGGRLFGVKALSIES